MHGMGRRLVGAAVTWVTVLGVVVVAVHPERCPSVSTTEIRAAAEAAVGWFEANVGSDGRFTYRYDRDLAVEEQGYNDVRHAGVLWSLYQAESAGIEGAADIADRGLDHVDASMRRTAVGPAFGSGSIVSTGASALLVAALDERVRATGLHDRDGQLLDLGRTLVATIDPSGAVDARIDVATGPVVGSRSVFFTGEVLWALARLELRFPGEGFGPEALKVLRYLVKDRDEVERPFPPASDHWAAYALATMTEWSRPPLIGDDELAWLDRQLGLFGVQVR
ncbi:MAG: hypothetical protein ACE5GB_05850, partial [Acidimicrobiales bacterium]